MLLIPSINTLGVNFQLIDQPGQRRQNTRPTVRIGGAAIFLGFLISLILGLFLDLSGLLSVPLSSKFWIVSAGATCAFFIGLTDDILSLSPWSRLIFQSALAFFAWLNGIKIDIIDFSFIYPQLGVIILPEILSLFFTLIWIVGVINAINWMDGLDGLAAGIVAITLLILIPIALSINQYSLCLLMVSTFGSSIGFLRYNFYPSKLIMGDGGSYFFGFILSTLTLLSSIFTENILSLHIAVLILFVPIFDMTYVIFKRTLDKKSPFYPDRRHLHHRLLTSGRGQRSTVVLIYAITQWFGVLALLLLNIIKLPIMIISTIVLTFCFFYRKPNLSKIK